MIYKKLNIKNIKENIIILYDKVVKIIHYILSVNE